MWKQYVWLVLMTVLFLEVPGRLMLRTVTTRRATQMLFAGVPSEELRAKLNHDFVDPATRIQYDYDMFLGWRAKPNQQGETYRLNSVGRRDDLEYSGVADQIVLLTGGSAAWSWGVSANRYTLPAQVNRQLETRVPRGHSVQVMNLAEQAYGMRQENSVVLENLDVAPELVVFYDGANDLHTIWLGKDPRRVRTWNSFDSLLRASLLATTDSSFVLTSSDLWRSSPTIRIGALPFRILQRFDAPPIRTLTPDEEAQIRSFFWEQIVRTHRTLAALGIQTLFVLQPVAYLGKPPHPAEAAFLVQPEWWRAAYQVLDSEYKQLNGHDGIQTLSLLNVLAEERRPVYLDAVHMNETGTEIVATAITSAIEELLMKTGSKGRHHGAVVRNLEDK